MVDVEITVQTGFLSEFSQLLFQNNFSINQLQLINKDNYTESYTINLVYSDMDLFNEFIKTIKDDPRSLAVTVRNKLEEFIFNGLFATKSNLDFNNEEEFETNHIGAYELLLNKVMTREDTTSFHRTVCSLSGYRVTEGRFSRNMHDYYYFINEMCASIVSRFTNINSFPQVINYSQTEDFLKTLLLIEDNYSAVILNYIEDDDDPDIYTTISQEISIPVVSQNFHIIPLIYASLFYRATSKYKMKFPNTNVGIIGLSSSANKLTELLNQIGCMRVLGYDENEKSMMHFESKKGLATTKANILENCDILFIVRDQLEELDNFKIRPGVIVISMTKEGINKFQNVKACKYLLDCSAIEKSFIIPGLVEGIIDREDINLNNTLLLDIAQLLITAGDELKVFPSIFSDIHTQIKNCITQYKEL